MSYETCEAIELTCDGDGCEETILVKDLADLRAEGWGEIDGETLCPVCVVRPLEPDEEQMRKLRQEIPK